MKKILAVASIAMLWTSGAWALGTKAGTDIDNYATLSYSAGGVSQPDVNSTTDTFKVDRKIDMVLVTTDTDQIEVTPGQTQRITSFAFQNEGNADQNFTFTVANLPNGGEADYDTDPDNEDVSDLVISCTGGSPDPATSPANGSVTIEVGMDDNMSCTVSATIPSAPTGADGDIMNIVLTAVAVDSTGANETETSGSDTQGAVDIVFADGESDTTLGSAHASKGDVAGNGEEVASSGYIISTPVLTAVKTSCVISDPVNGTNNPKRIPGAIIRYMFDIENTGTGDVSDLNISDTLNDNLDLTNTQSSAKKDENVDSCSCGTEPTTDISADTTVNNQDVTIENINVPSEKHTCVSIEVEIK